MVILGGGFAGLYAARALRDAPVAVTLMDRKNHLSFLCQANLHKIRDTNHSRGLEGEPHAQRLRDAEDRFQLRIAGCGE